MADSGVTRRFAAVLLAFAVRSHKTRRSIERAT
jgi:hypothetical protein